MKSIWRITRKMALEQWGGIGITKVTPQAIWPIAKSLVKRDGPRAPTAIHGSSGLKFHPSERANTTDDYLEIQFTPHDLCDENHERRAEARVQALLEAVHKSPPPEDKTMCLTKINKFSEIQKGLQN
jgi:hypothetical protein